MAVCLPRALKQCFLRPPHADLGCEVRGRHSFKVEAPILHIPPSLLKMGGGSLGFPESGSSSSSLAAHASYFSIRPFLLLLLRPHLFS